MSSLKTALVHGAADGRLLGRKEFQRGRDHAFVIAIVKNPEGAFDAEVGRLLGAFETLELDAVVADGQLIFERQRGVFFAAVGHRAGDPHHDQDDA